MNLAFKNLGDCLRLPVREGDDALVDFHTGEPPRRLTYRELEQRLNAFAHRLADSGIQPGDRVAILGSNCLEYLVAYLGTMRLGAVTVPVNHKLAPATVHHILADSQSTLAFCDKERRALLPGGIETRDLHDSELFTADSEAPPFPVFEPDEDDLAEILYTSGSTGLPKGVPLTHWGQCWAIGKNLLAIDPEGEAVRTIIAAPMYHMNALFFSVLALANRMSLYLMPRFDAREYLRIAAQYRCTYLTGVPTMFALTAQVQDGPSPRELAHVERVHMGSSPLTDALVEQVHKVFPNAAVSNGYGTTEAGPAVFGPHPDGLPTPETALGYPLPDIEWRFSNGSYTEGPLELRTPAVTPGYLNRPEANAKQFNGDWYVTNDVMRRDENGFFYFVGRADDMFVCGGENIYPGQVESLLEEHPGVAQAAVVPVAHDIKGMVPVAFVVPRGGEKPSEEQLKQFALENGPAYAHPRRVFFLDALPLSGTNKIDKNCLEKEASR